MSNIGTIFRDEKKLGPAISWFRRAARLGDADANLEIAKAKRISEKAVVSLLFTFMYFRSSTGRRFPLQFELIVINGGTDEIF